MIARPIPVERASERTSFPSLAVWKTFPVMYIFAWSLSGRLSKAPFTTWTSLREASRSETFFFGKMLRTRIVPLSLEYMVLNGEMYFRSSSAMDRESEISRAMESRTALSRESLARRFT